MFSSIMSYILNMLKVDDLENRYLKGKDVLPICYDEIPLEMRGRGPIYSSKNLSKEK